MQGRAYLPGGRRGAGLAALRAEVARISALFQAAGAEMLDPPALLPAGALIDLYGEDLRARAYTTHDPVAGEQMLRPDYTVPIVQMHMAQGQEPARYCYAGPVWRRQEPGSDRPSEYLQVGFELFDGSDPARADARIMALMAEALGGAQVTPATGDMGILIAAVDGLSTTDRRKAALRRHLWRPGRFRHLVQRYGSAQAPSDDRAALLRAVQGGTLAAHIRATAPLVGLRSAAEIAERARVLAEDAATPPLDPAEVNLLTRILTLRGTLAEAVAALAAIAAQWPALAGAARALADRAQALAEAGFAPETLPFEASYGRTTLEYYDGFVFGFHAPGRPDLRQIAQGGRYDALTRVLGQGRGIPAVGGIVRPEALLALKGGA